MIDPGRDRRQDRGARDGESATQGRYRKMLRRGHQPQTQTAGKAEGRQETHAPGWFGGSAAVGVPGGLEAGLRGRPECHTEQIEV